MNMKVTSFITILPVFGVNWLIGQRSEAAIITDKFVFFFYFVFFKLINFEWGIKIFSF
jgi:hypothetical protein